MKKFLLLIFLLLLGGTTLVRADENYDRNQNMLIRISEIEVYPEYFDEYLRFAQEVAETSVTKENGVVSIYPMMQVRNKYQIRILEIYKDKAAYDKHIASPHFQKYKQGTLHMVKSLDLVDMFQLSPHSFEEIFKKSSQKEEKKFIP